MGLGRQVIGPFKIAFRGRFARLIYIRPDFRQSFFLSVILGLHPINGLLRVLKQLSCRLFLTDQLCTGDVGRDRRIGEASTAGFAGACAAATVVVPPAGGVVAGAPVVGVDVEDVWAFVGLAACTLAAGGTIFLRGRFFGSFVTTGSADCGCGSGVWGGGGGGVSEISAGNGVVITSAGAFACEGNCGCFFVQPTVTANRSATAQTAN